ncbi:YbhB/YbcL family Raf kinase inhibitor-like protein [Lysobacter sp. CA199]|uniref:YbhB/YbcL family Raf kinase inhibitor-like protein n=1 Tax=Lysobacter sp. CA199 TaxID=3455608 RepID=UPI003F8D2413
MEMPHCLVLSSLLLALAPLAHAADFVVESPDVREGEVLAPAFVLKGAGCNGSNTSPRLDWKNPPAGTRSFAVTVHDLDAPGDAGFWHWLVVNIPAKTYLLDHGASNGGLPAGALQIRNDYGRAGYGGPCPPPGQLHRYEFTVWALKTDKLKIETSAGGALAGFMIKQNALGQAKLTAKYER